MQHMYNIDNRFTNHKVHFTVMNHCTITTRRINQYRNVMEKIFHHIVQS